MTHGPEAVHELIEESGWSYPVTVNRLENEHMLENIELDSSGNSIMLTELLADTRIDRFESKDDLEQKLEPVFEAEIREREGGILDRLKRILLGKSR